MMDLLSRIERYLDYLTRSGHLPRRVHQYRIQLEYLARWCERECVEGGIDLDVHVDHLNHELDLETGEPIRINTRRERLAKARRFAHWLNKSATTTKTLSP